MKIVAMNTKTDDAKDIAEMIYYTDKFLAQLMFGYKKNSVVSTLCRLIERGNNFFGYENINLIVNEEAVLGYYIGFKVAKAHSWSVTRSYISTMSYIQLARYIFYSRRVINQLLISHMNQDDYYLSNMYVKPASRNNGVGSLTLRHVITDALRLGCKRIVLDAIKQVMSCYGRPMA
jgi:GNAT superfamily N-acetyltransferase